MCHSAQQGRSCCWLCIALETVSYRIQVTEFLDFVDLKISIRLSPNRVIGDILLWSRAVVPVTQFVGTCFIVTSRAWLTGSGSPTDRIPRPTFSSVFRSLHGQSQERPDVRTNQRKRLFGVARLVQALACPAVDFL
jgi:hypothetical protein